MTRQWPAAFRRRIAFVVAMLCGGAGLVPAWAANGSPVRFREVAQLPLLGAPEVPDAEVAGSGWLILNPVTRRGYQVFEARNARTGNRARTILQSFDLDTLQPRRRAVLAGVPITSGTGDVATVGATFSAGEIVHAVDRERGRLYLALSQPGSLEALPGQLLGTGLPPDGQRPIARFVAIDEAAFDRGDFTFAASFREPVEQARLHAYWVLGMAVTRHHVAGNDPGRLVVLFAQPQAGSSLNPVPLFDHTLAQWDPSGLVFRTGDELVTDPDALGLTVTGQLTSQAVAADGPARRLDVCQNGTVASPGATGMGNYQWGLLTTADAVWTACSGAVVSSGVDADGRLVPVGGQLRFELERPRISDVLVDEGGARLLVRSFGNGHTWTVFDTASGQVAGIVLAKGTDFYAMAAGVDGTTGRLYQLLPDHTVVDGGFAVSVQGGLQYVDTRAASVSGTFTNERPDLAYPAIIRIQVDPVTERFFVWRGHRAHSSTVVYPGTQATTPAPVEPFYRVFEDNVKR